MIIPIRELVALMIVGCNDFLEPQGYLWSTPSVFLLVQRNRLYNTVGLVANTRVRVALISTADYLSASDCRD